MTKKTEQFKLNFILLGRKSFKNINMTTEKVINIDVNPFLN